MKQWRRRGKPHSPQVVKIKWILNLRCTFTLYSNFTQTYSWSALVPLRRVPLVSLGPLKKVTERSCGGSVLLRLLPLQEFEPLNGTKGSVQRGSLRLQEPPPRTAGKASRRVSDSGSSTDVLVFSLWDNERRCLWAGLGFVCPTFPGLRRTLDHVCVCRRAWGANISKQPLAEVTPYSFAYGCSFPEWPAGRHTALLLFPRREEQPRSSVKPKPHFLTETKLWNF